MFEFEVFIEDRAEGRRFLKLCRRNNLFKRYPVKWKERSLIFTFKDKEERDAVGDIVRGSLAVMNIEHKVAEDELSMPEV